MADGALVDRLDAVVDAIVARRDATSALTDPELTALAVLAADLRYAPGAAFAARLRATLTRRITMASILVARVRDGFTTVTPFLKAKDAGLSAFLTQVFGAEATSTTAGRGGSIHRELRVGNSMIMIGEGGPEGVVPIRPVAFHVYVPDVDAAFARALAAGGESMGEPSDHSYGERAGYVKDAYGNHWYIATSLGPSPVPAGLRTVTPFMHVAGAPAFIEFLKVALGAQEEARHESEGVVRHAVLRIGNGAIELGEAEGRAQPMPATFYLYVGDADALYNQAVAAGAKSLSAPADQWYGDRVASVEDTMGNQWFIARPA